MTLLWSIEGRVLRTTQKDVGNFGAHLEEDFLGDSSAGNRR